MESKFLKYPSIESGDNSKYVRKMKEIYDKTKFIATEKIHGANFQFIVSKGDNGELIIKCGKRTSILEEDENFYGWQTVRDKYTESLKILFEQLVNENPTDNIKGFRLFGEIFGGKYPGIKANGFKPVQQGIYYFNQVDFMGFDLFIVCNNPDSEIQNLTETMNKIKVESEADTKAETEFKTVTNMSCTATHKLFENCSANEKFILKLVPIIMEGEFNTVYDFCKQNREFQTIIPKLYGLEDLPDNYAEGYVMRADVKTTLTDQSRYCIVKIKNKKFDEIIAVKQKVNESNNASEKVIFHQDSIKNYLTQNRLDNVVSKIGPSSPKMRIIGSFIADAKEDYEKTLESNEPDLNEEFSELEQFKKLWKAVSKPLFDYCADNFTFPE